MEFKNLHIACGRVYADEYLNIDWNPKGLKVNLEEGIPTKVNNTYVMKWNIDKGLPVKKETLDIVYHSHFLEHLPKNKGIEFLKTCYSCLKPNSIMRVAVPDFKLWSNNYVHNEQSFFDWYSSNFCKSKENLTNLEIFNQMIYSGHFCMYDFETLQKVLTSIGFKNIQRKEWGNSTLVTNIGILEKDSSKRKPESLVLECEK